MTKLALPSAHRATIAFVLQSLRAMAFPTKRSSALLTEALSAVKADYASATMQQKIKARVHLEEVTGNIGHYAGQGDTDLLAAYAKFSVIEFPFMPLAVGHFRAALGKYKVSNLLTRELLEVHERAALLFVEVHGDFEESGIERNADHLMQFIFRNLDHADDIIAIMQERRITSPKEIAHFIDDRRVMPALSEGML